MQKHVKRSPAAIKEALCGYISISPWLLGFIILTFIPILSTIYYSFTRWTIMDDPVWIGLENYIRMFTKEPLFYQAVKATSLYVAMSLPVIIVFGVLLSPRSYQEFPSRCCGPGCSSRMSVLSIPCSAISVSKDPNGSGIPTGRSLL
jgi:ABC-type sugar transport system permease subunit